MEIIEEIVKRSRKTEHGFNDLQLAANEIILSGDAARSKQISLELLCSEFHQARCVGTFLLGHLAALDLDALHILKDRVSNDDDWRVQEILAKAFDQFCRDTGYRRRFQLSATGCLPRFPIHAVL